MKHIFHVFQTAALLHTLNIDSRVMSMCESAQKLFVGTGDGGIVKVHLDVRTGHRFSSNTVLEFRCLGNLTCLLEY